MKLSRPLILLALAAVLPLTVLAAVVGVTGLRQEQQVMQTEAEARVDLASVLVQQELDRHVAVLSAVAQSGLFDGPLDAPAVGAYVDRIAHSQPFWRAIFVSDASGRRLASSTTAGMVYPDRAVDTESHRLAVTTARPVVGRIMRRPNGVLAFVVRVPVIRGGKVAYIASALIEPEGLRRLYLGNPLPEGWRAGLIDASGRVVVRINAPQEAVGGFAPPDTLRIRQQSSSGFAQTMSLEGAPMISAFKVLPGYRWSIHAAIPYDLYQAPLTRSLWLLGGAAALSLLLAGLFLWLLARETALRQREVEALEEGRRMEALGRMTGGVAHDFNNLLMIVQGSAEMLKRRRAEPERIGIFADAILSAAQRGQTLTRQLLAFARRSAHEPVDFNLQDRAAILDELIRRSVGERVVSTLSVPASAWPLRADPDALEIALINLAVNARDAMPDGGALSIVAANVSLRRERGGVAGLEGDYVSIAVKDSGSGVPEEHLGHIFEPFFTTKPAGRGTGLGLSQVYGFARQSGGAVTVASRPGEGATFTLYLPRATKAPVAAAPAAAAANASEPGRLLLVEDDPEVASTIEVMLASGGYAVTRATDAASALALAQGGTGFDVVLSDILPDQSGHGLVATLRRDQPGLAVLLMSGDPNGPAETSGETVLQKPFGPDQVFAALSRARAAARRLAQPLSA